MLMLYSPVALQPIQNLQPELPLSKENSLLAVGNFEHKERGRRVYNVRMKTRLLFATILLLVGTLQLNAQAPKCDDAADDSHFSVLYENNRVRILSLELGRLEATKLFAFKSPHMVVVTTDSRTTTNPANAQGPTTSWQLGNTHFVWNTGCRTVKNDLSTTHKAVVVETHLPAHYDELQDYEVLTDLSTLKPTTSVSLTRGALTATQHQVAPGDTAQLNAGDHALIALNDLELSTDNDKEISLNSQEVKILHEDISALKNAGKSSARFVVVDF